VTEKKDPAPRAYAGSRANSQSVQRSTHTTEPAPPDFAAVFPSCPEQERWVSVTGWDVTAEFFSSSRPLDDKACAWLRRRGISDHAIERDFLRSGAPIHEAHVLYNEGFFDFACAEHPEAVRAFVVLARNEEGAASDIVAFDLAGRIGFWLGREFLLGADLILAPRMDDPLRVYPDVWTWLAGERDGIVIFDWRKAARHLEGVMVEVDNVEFGRRLRRLLGRPAPPIVIRVKCEAAA
jgi:hypothetical protein